MPFFKKSVFLKKNSINTGVSVPLALLKRQAFFSRLNCKKNVLSLAIKKRAFWGLKAMVTRLNRYVKPGGYLTFLKSKKWTFLPTGPTNTFVKKEKI